MCPSGTTNETLSSAVIPPKRTVTPSTRNRPGLVAIAAIFGSLLGSVPRRYRERQNFKAGFTLAPMPRPRAWVVPSAARHTCFSRPPDNNDSGDRSMTIRPRTALQRRGLLLGTAALMLPLALPTLAHAQSFPSKPITLIVPWPAGGSTDRHLRALSEIASKNLGQTITVENRPGGGGTTGPGTMALTAKPDGYTIAQYPMGMLRVPHMQKVPWDPLKDFTFIIGVSGYTFGFTVRSDSPYKTFNEYVEAARKEPGKIDYGSTGIGTSPHLLMEELAGNAKVTLNHVPFKGNADLTQALLGGH